MPTHNPKAPRRAPIRPTSQAAPSREDGADATTARMPHALYAGLTRRFAGILSAGSVARPLPIATLVLAAFALLGPNWSSAARADILSQDQSFSDRKTDFADPATLTFDKFDSLGGTRELVSVTIRYEQTLRTHVTIPKPPKGAVINVNVGSNDQPPTLETASPFGLDLDAAAGTQSQVLTQLTPIEMVWSWQEGHAYTNDWSNSTSWTTTFIDPAALALFTGDGTLSLLSTGSSWSRYRSSTGSG